MADERGALPRPEICQISPPLSNGGGTKRGHGPGLSRIRCEFFAVKDKRSNGCFPRTEGAVEPYRGEERVRVRSEPGATLSLKPLDDRLGEAAMLNAAICATFGARRGIPGP
jgi:hypothetical protein